MLFKSSVDLIISGPFKSGHRCGFVQSHCFLSYAFVDEMNQQLHEAMLSLQHLSSVVLPEIKRVSNAILVLASNAGITHVSTLESLLLDAHRITGAAIKGIGHVVNEESDDSDVVKMRKVCLRLTKELF